MNVRRNVTRQPYVMLEVLGNLYRQWLSRVPDGSLVLDSVLDTPLKKCRGKSLSPHNTPHIQQHITTQLWNCKTALAKKNLKIYTTNRPLLKKQLNATSLNTRVSVLNKCRLGFKCGFLKSWPVVICKSHKYTTKTQPHIWCVQYQFLVKRLVTTLSGKEHLVRSAD